MNNYIEKYIENEFTDFTETFMRESEVDINESLSECGYDWLISMREPEVEFFG